MISLTPDLDSASDSRPLIVVTTQVHDLADQAERALAAPDAGIYVRGGQLVRVTRDACVRRGIARELGAATIRPVAFASSIDLLSRWAQWGRWDSRSDRTVATTPPPAVCAALLARGEWPALRPLAGVLEAPSLRSDGSVIQSRGYDEATGYLYEPSIAFPQIPESPSLADAEASCAELLSVVADFPFAAPMHRAAWLSALLTLFARPAIVGCTPLFVVDATTAGTGKGKLADVIANIASGRDGTKAVLPDDEDEFRKRISALLVEGDALAVLDNVHGILRSASLDACLTTTVWKDRRLGVTGTLTVDNRLVWIATTNNLSLGADTARRTIHVRLETTLERPELREDFAEPDLLRWVREHRARLVVAALTILRAHAVAGRPRAGVALLGGFESWSTIVAAACAWCGAGDPLATQTALACGLADTVRGTLYPLVEGLARLTEHEALTAREILSRLYPAPHAPDAYGDLREAIEACACPPGKTNPTPTRLGQALRSHRGRVVAGRTIGGAVAHGGALRWRVTAVAPQAPPAAPAAAADGPADLFADLLS